LVNVIVLAAQTPTTTAGKRRDCTSRVDNDSLSLRWIRTTPQINVVRSVALKESTNLLGSQMTIPVTRHARPPDWNSCGNGGGGGIES